MHVENINSIVKQFDIRILDIEHNFYILTRLKLKRQKKYLLA